MRSDQDVKRGINADPNTSAKDSLMITSRHLALGAASLQWMGVRKMGDEKGEKFQTTFSTCIIIATISDLSACERVVSFKKLSSILGHHQLTSNKRCSASVLDLRCVSNSLTSLIK